MRVFLVFLVGLGSVLKQMRTFVGLGERLDEFGIRTDFA
jgi:hypothetical protein